MKAASIEPAVVLVVFGGPAPITDLLAGLDVAALAQVVVADRGLDHAIALGLSPDVVVGDLDSVDPEVLAQARADGVLVREFPADKARSDLELALEVAAEFDPSEIIVVGSGGGRLDHVIANLAVLGDRTLHHVAVSARFDTSVITIVGPGAQRSISGSPGATFSVFALGGDASGVCITGARWPLVDAQLSPTGTLGLSNEFLAGGAAVEISSGSGTLAVVQSP